MARIERIAFAELTGWGADDHGAALPVFLRSCSHARSTGQIAAADLTGLQGAAEAARSADARRFFEQAFVPLRIRDGDVSLFTGYYEPELLGSRQSGGIYRHPIYAPPPDLPEGRPWLSRAEIAAGALSGRGLEIVWLRDPVEAFFMHVQGSARIRLEEGGTARLGFAGRNGHPYRSVGRHMVARGLLAPHEASAQAIKTWVRENGAEGEAVLNHNPSYIFFEERPELEPGLGPVGALGISVTAMRSLAVDPDYVPLGAPVWVETEGPEGPISHLMIAQDVGSAIKGAQRGDIFFGSGDAAGALAGRMRANGSLTTLVPRQAAARLGFA
ncbi:MAG: MltA domain-containing protein [Pseudomonadota bacterium]